MAFQRGTQIQPRLGAVDFSPVQRGAEVAGRQIMQGVQARAQAQTNAAAIQAQAFSNLGQQIGSAVQKIGQKQEEKKRKESLDNLYSNIGKTLMGDSQMGGPNQAGMNADMSPVQQFGRKLYTDSSFRKDMINSEVEPQQLLAYAQMAEQMQAPPRKTVEQLMAETPRGMQPEITKNADGTVEVTYTPMDVDVSSAAMRSADNLLTKYTDSQGNVDTDSFYAEAARIGLPNSVLVEYTKDFKRRGLLSNEQIAEVPVFEQKVRTLAETLSNTQDLSQEAARDSAVMQILGGGFPEDPLTGAAQFPRAGQGAGRSPDRAADFAGAAPEDRPTGTPGPDDPAIDEPTEDLSLSNFSINTEEDMESLLSSGEFDQVQEAIDSGAFSLSNIEDPTTQITQRQMNSLFGLSGVTKNVANAVSDFFGAEALPSEALNSVRSELNSLTTWTFVVLADELVTGKASNEVRQEIENLLPEAGSLKQAGPRAARERMRNFVQYVEAQQTILEDIRDNRNGQYAPDARRSAANRLPIIRDFILPSARSFLRAFEGLNPVDQPSAGATQEQPMENVPTGWINEFEDADEARRLWRHVPEDDRQLFME